ncbi:MAG TPA: transcriptional repressor [Methylomirabilota bacterium]|jgi:Fe2+ or Zn2+ uptake regulation protein|nr:transcriptional repressor [Methylomirabilota bacterium]
MAGEVQKRVTRQLAAVYEALQGDLSHPSAEEIYQRVRRTLPHISLGTVYRNLQRLVEEGKVRLLLLDERVARYDAMTAEHDHFICQQCGCVIDILLARERQMNLTPLLEQGFTVASHSLAVHGLCRQCRGRRPKKSRAQTPQHNERRSCGARGVRS